MPENSPGPYFIRFFYTSSFAPHVMTVPLKGWSAGVDNGDFDVWGGGTLPVVDSVDDFITLIKPFFPTTVDFTHYSIYSQPTPTSDAVPVVTAPIASGAGTNVAPGWSRAVSSTFNFKTDLGGNFKIVLLDSASGDAFNPISLTDITGAALAFVNFIIGDDSFFAGRDGGRPSFCQRITYDLNDGLRKQYHMG